VSHGLHVLALWIFIAGLRLHRACKCRQEAIEVHYFSVILTFVVAELKRIVFVSHDSSACLKNISVSISLLPRPSHSNVASVFVGVSFCHIMFQNDTKVTCLVLKNVSEPSLLSITWQDGHYENFSANIACQSSVPFMLRLIDHNFLTMVADPTATSIQAQCHRGKLSGWIILRGSSLSAPFVRVQVVSTISEFSNKFLLTPNYSSFDFAAFVHPNIEGHQNASVSLSSDEFNHQKFFIGVIGKKRILHFCVANL
jgi:hypothetical protein